MLRMLRTRVTFANLVAIIALFVSLAGSVYAASRINGRQIRPNSIPGNRLKAGTVAGSRLLPDSVTGKEVNESTLGKVPLAATAVGLGTITVERGTGSPVGPGGVESASANCLPGQQAIGGGGRGDATNTNGVLIESRPQTPTGSPSDGDTFESWRATAVNTGVSGTIAPQVWVICVG